jgi:predicted O-methyltransferase YrrM
MITQLIKKLTRATPEVNRTELLFPPGHFYSPIVDTTEALQRAETLWPKSVPSILGIDFDIASHERILCEEFPRFINEYDYPEHETDVLNEYDFFTQNSQFSWLDARAAFVLIRSWQPRRVIEVGSGFSSLLMADINRRFCNSKMHITCIEPYPRGFLKTGVPGIAQLVEKKVQDVELSTFDSLGAGDVLFIDSSHVSKTGSDVNHLYFEVLPRLKRGVRVHVHDIFLPNEYLKEWVINENRSWNEQYLLRALLMYSNAFRVVFGNAFAFSAAFELVQKALAHPKGHAFGGGSIWIERI